MHTHSTLRSRPNIDLHSLLHTNPEKGLNGWEQLQPLFSCLAAVSSSRIDFIHVPGFTESLRLPWLHCITKPLLGFMILFTESGKRWWSVMVSSHVSARTYYNNNAIQCTLRLTWLNKSALNQSPMVHNEIIIQTSNATFDIKFTNTARLDFYRFLCLENLENHINIITKFDWSLIQCNRGASAVRFAIHFISHIICCCPACNARSIFFLLSYEGTQNL